MKTHLYQRIADRPEFRAAVMRGVVARNKLQQTVPDIECGSTVIGKARGYVLTGARGDVPNMPTPEKQARVDEWTIPAEGQTLPMIQAQKAPARGNTWKRFVIASDVHGDEQNKEANAEFFRFVEDAWKPELRIMAGDLWDFRPLRKNCNADEKRESMQSDYSAGLSWLIRFKPQYFLRGNHDERLWDVAANSRGIEQDFAVEKIRQIEPMLDELKINMLPYHIRDGILKLGHMKVAHGFFNGIHCAKQMADCYDSIMFGHNHAIIVHPVAGLERRAARCIGALCNLLMPYNSRRPSALRQASGWAYGVHNEASGNYHTWQAEELDGDWIFPADVVKP